MKFYIAAYVGEKERVRHLQEYLSGHGHEITVDWTQFNGVQGTQRDAQPAKTAEIALRDMDGIKRCDVFVLLADPPDGRGKYAELGVAITLASLRGKPRVYVLGEQTHHSVFFYHPLVRRVASMDAVLDDLDDNQRAD